MILFINSLSKLKVLNDPAIINLFTNAQEQYSQWGLNNYTGEWFNELVNHVFATGAQLLTKFNLVWHKDVGGHLMSIQIITVAIIYKRDAC